MQEETDMRRMIWFEWKRIWQSRLTQFAAAGCALFLIFCVWSSIQQIMAVDSEGNTVFGMDAAKTLREFGEKQTLDQETVDGIVKEYLERTENPETASEDSNLEFLSEEVYRTWYLPRRELYSIIRNVYWEDGRQDTMAGVLRDHYGEDFYEARTRRVQEWLSVYRENQVITPAEADWWTKKDAAVGTYQYGYYKGWDLILAAASTWTILIMMIACIGIAPVFAGEYQTKCDSLLLCMRYGKSRLIAAKLLASWLYVSAVYWGIALVYCAIYLLLLGTGGWDLPVQISSTNAVSYNLNMAQASGLVLLLGWLYTLGMTGITLFLSSLLKNAYSVIIAAFLLLIVPTFLSMSSGGYLWKHVLALLPAKITDFSFTSYLVFRMGGLIVTWPTAAMALNGAGALLLSGLAYAVFRRHQVNR